MKKVFQWMSALALMVMCTCAFVACSDDDDNNSGGSWTSSKNAKILGTWEISSVSSDDPDFDPFRPGPEMGQIISFKSDGTFTQGGESGTFKYNNETGAFSITSKHMSSKGTARVSENGESMVGTIDVTSDGVTVTYTIEFEKAASGGDEGGDGGDEGGDTDWSQYVQDSRMVGTWTLPLRGCSLTSLIGAKRLHSTATVPSTIGGHSYTYSTKTDTNNEDRIKFTLYLDGEAVNEGRLVLVCGGGVLNGEYWTPGQKQDRNMALVMKKPNFTYPSGGVKGRWKITTVYMNDGPSVGEVIVFNSEGEMYIEGDAHVNHYTYSGNDSGGTLNIELDKDGEVPGTLTISNGIATFEVGGQPAIVLQKQ